MAVFREVNKAIQKHVAEKHPHKDIVIEAVRGAGYVYFNPLEIPSVYAHPIGTSTEDMVRLCCQEVDAFLQSLGGDYIESDCLRASGEEWN